MTKSADDLLLIVSNAFCGPHFASDFGNLPIAFLPIGNRRLYKLQHERAGRQRVLMSLPHEFDLTPQDLLDLNELEISIIRTSPAKRIADVIGLSLQAAAPTGGLSLLYGSSLPDTRIVDQADTVGVTNTGARTTKSWAAVNCFEDAGPDVALSGYFAFSDAGFLLDCIEGAGHNFFAGVRSYRKERGLIAVPIKATQMADRRSYFLSRTKLATTRSFNKTVVTGGGVKKASEQLDKISAELAWFRACPTDLSRFLPRIHGFGSEERLAWYETEHLELPTLGDVYVFGRQSEKAWRGAFRAISDFLATCRRSRPVDGFAALESAQSLLLEKTQQRLEIFASLSGFGLSREWKLNGKRIPSLLTVAHEAAQHISPATNLDLCIVHGDLCFSNMFFDFRNCSLKVIDPRGIDGHGARMLYGDQRYDIAKLYHSAIGLYDFVVAGRMKFGWGPDIEFQVPRDGRVERVKSDFLDVILDGNRVKIRESAAMSVLLFLSMLPLHRDNLTRQRALMANAFRLYDDLMRSEF